LKRSPRNRRKRKEEEEEEEGEEEEDQEEEEEDQERGRRKEEEETTHELTVQKLAKDSAQALQTLWPPPLPPNLALHAPSPSEKRGRPLLTEGGACQNCRRKKNRCDRETPCGSCLKLMIKDPSVRCVYGPDSASGGGGGEGGGGALGGIGHRPEFCIPTQDSAARRLAQEGGVGESNESNERNESNESKKAQLRWYYRPCDCEGAEAKVRQQLASKARSRGGISVIVDRRKPRGTRS
jgi:hypothetical protein